MWKPSLATSGARYLAIADAIAADIASGALGQGAQLPTQRELADHLGVTVGTVTRGYAEATRRGLIVGHVGRGTFVGSPRDVEDFGWRAQGGGEVIDLSLSLPWVSSDGEQGRALAATLRDIADGPPLEELMQFSATTGVARHLAAGAAWIASMGHSISASQVVVTNGAQHGINIALAALLNPGDLVAVGELTYPGLRTAARNRGVRLVPIDLDGEGMVPAALDRACAGQPVRAVYCVPTLQNPTSATMSDRRRAAIAEVARRHDLVIIEDAIHHDQASEPVVALASFAPERSLILTSLTKWVTFGLRVGFVGCPESMVNQLRAQVRASSWMPAPLMVEIATRWIEDGTAVRLADKSRLELAARHELARDLFAGLAVTTAPGAMYLWIELGEAVRSDECVALARERGVLIAGAEAFAAGRQVPHAVRVALAAPVTRAELERGLRVIREVIESPAPCAEIL